MLRPGTRRVEGGPLGAAGAVGASSNELGRFTRFSILVSLRVSTSFEAEKLAAKLFLLVPPSPPLVPVSSSPETDRLCGLLVRSRRPPARRRASSSLMLVVVVLDRQLPSNLPSL
jgi:hypothetical protein